MANNEDLDNNNNNEEWSTIDVSASGNSTNNGIEFEIEQEEPLIVKPPRQDQFDYGDWDYEEEDSLEDRQTKVTRKYEISFVYCVKFKTN